MIDDFAKDYLHQDLRWVRQSMLGQINDLSEYEIRRPMTSTGTNLLGLIKHLTMTGDGVLRRDLRQNCTMAASPLRRAGLSQPGLAVGHRVGVARRRRRRLPPRLGAR